MLLIGIFKFFINNSVYKAENSPASHDVFRNVWSKEGKGHPADNVLVIFLFYHLNVYPRRKVNF